MLVLIGPSASGKTEIAKVLSLKYNMSKIVTYTTRKPRVGEIDGKDYNFVSIEQFASLSKQNFFVETTYYNTNYYGTAKKDIKDDKCVILDTNGLKSFKALNDDHIIFVLITASEEIRYKRMLGRGDLESDAKVRLINDAIAFSEDKLKDVTFTISSENDSIENLANSIYDRYINLLKERS